MSDVVGLNGMAEDSVLDAAAARELTRQIKVALEHSYTMIIAAYQGQAWWAMGYSSWDAYCQGEFGNLTLQPPREERQNIIMSMREAGLSLRAVASATNLSRGTVANELEASPDVQNWTPELSTENAAQVTTGLDGKSYQPARKRPGVEPRPDRPVRPAFEDVPLSDELLDLPAEDIGIEPLDVRGRRRASESRAVVLRRLSGSMDAALPSMIRTAGELVQTLPGTGADGDDVEAFSDFAADASNGILTLSQVLAGIDPSVLRGCAEDAAEVSGVLTDAVDVLGRVLDDLHQR